MTSAPAQPGPPPVVLPALLNRERAILEFNRRVLAQARRYPELVPNVGNIALLQRAEAAGLLPEGVGRDAADAYRNLRRAQHEARLNERPTQVPQVQLATDQAAVLALWQAVFDVPAGSATHPIA